VSGCPDSPLKEFIEDLRVLTWMVGFRYPVKAKPDESQGRKATGLKTCPGKTAELPKDNQPLGMLGLFFAKFKYPKGV